MSSKKSVKSLKETVKGWLPVIYLVLGIFALRSSLVEPYVVPTGSMEPTLKTGDRLYALKCAYEFKMPFYDFVVPGTRWMPFRFTLFKLGEVKRGDVILFQAPHRPDQTYVKRAVGLPGDKIEFDDGQLIVNGKPATKVDFPNRDVLYDIERNYDKRLYLEDLTGVKHYVILDGAFDHTKERYFGPITVPEGHYLAVGDNRDHSYDSRSWGFVPYENLKGRAMFIWFSGWDPLLQESMVADRSLLMQLVFFGVDFFRFLGDYFKGDAWLRYERIGTLIH